MTDVTQVCDNFRSARVFIINTRLDEIGGTYARPGGGTGVPHLKETAFPP